MFVEVSVGTTFQKCNLEIFSKAKNMHSQQPRNFTPVCSLVKFSAPGHTYKDISFNNVCKVSLLSGLTLCHPMDPSPPGSSIYSKNTWRSLLPSPGGSS